MRLRLALLLAAAPSAVLAQLPRALPEAAGMSTAKLRAIHAQLDSAVGREEAVGIVLMVAHNGKLVLVDSAGYADREAKTVMRSGTLFRLASMSKAVTSVAAMMLVEEGRLLLSDPVSRYIPAFRQMRVAVITGPDSARKITYERARRQITVRDLLTHRSGLSYSFSDAGPVGDLYRAAGVTDGIAKPDIATLAENIDRLAKQPLRFQPGSDFYYGLNSDVLGRVIEVVSGRTLAEFFQERIFTPLDMKETGFLVPDERMARLVTPYTPDSAGKLVPIPGPSMLFNEGRLTLGGKENHGSATYFSGGAGLVGSAADYLRFIQMLANGGELEGHRLLGRKTVELMTQSHTGDLAGAPIGPGNGFGLGFAVVEDAGKAGAFGTAGSYSWGGIYGTQFWVDPKEHLTVVYMIQRYPVGGNRPWSIVRDMIYAALK